MRFKKAYKSAACIFLSFVLLFLSLSFMSLATTQSDLEDKIEQIDKQITENQAKLDALKNDKSKQETYIKTLQSQINSVAQQVGIMDDNIDTLQGEIDIVQDEIDELNSQIKTIDNKITQKQNEIYQTSQSLKERLKAIYMAGEGSTVEILFSSGDFGMFLTRMELLKRISDNDTALVNQLKKDAEELNTQRQELDAKKAEVEVKKAELDERMKTLEVKKGKLDSRKKELNSLETSAQSQMDNLDRSSTIFQNLIEKALIEKEKYAKQLEEYLKANGSSSSDGSTASASKGGMICPVPYSSVYISLYFGVTTGYYTKNHPHTGLDLSLPGAYGKKIVAAASGKVITAYGGGGYNSGWGNFIQIDHGGGVVTGYAHCKSITVSKGDTVTAGQVIGYIGTTGAAYGAHLHFVVWNDGNRVNPLPWIKNGGSIRYNP